MVNPTSCWPVGFASWDSPRAAGRGLKPLRFDLVDASSLHRGPPSNLAGRYPNSWMLHFMNFMEHPIILWHYDWKYATSDGKTPLCNKSLYGQSHSGLRLQCDFKLAKSFKKKIAPKDCKYIPGVKLYPKSNDKSIQQKELKKSYCQVLKSWSLTLPTYWCFSRRE